MDLWADVRPSNLTPRLHVSQYQILGNVFSVRRTSMPTMMGMRPQMMQHMVKHVQIAIEEGGADAMEFPMMMELQEKHHSNR
jgi:hypothetical protein